MAIKKITENPKITDTFLFEIITPNADGCFDSNPYKIDKVTVYFVERDFLGSNFGEYELIKQDKVLTENLKLAKKELCNNSTEENELKVMQIEHEIKQSESRSNFYYKDREAVFVLGVPENPAWLSTESEESRLVQAVDENNDPIIGHFELNWNPEGSIRAGDYFVCWTWTPNPSGESLSSHIPFKVLGDGSIVQTLPIHITPKEKYSTLLERYLPEMFKSTISDNDITPEQLHKLNESIAEGFRFLEDQANQIIDLFDANALHESMLVYLSNLFNVKLKSNDPTLWRRQIKEAVPLFKKKGTKSGLEQAFAQAGMTLLNLTQYWQLVSPYTFQESFVVKDSPVFVLTKEKIILPINDTNFGLWIRRKDENDYIPISKDNVSFEIGNDYIVRMTWIGDQLSSGSTSIYEGDIIRVLYEYNSPSDSSEQAEEDYIKLLPLMDQRDEMDQKYPLKNWNVRLIEESDPLFDILVPVKHPWHEFIIFGKIRTEFPYSENIYNMDEYNGSTRDSYDACMIDKEFIDPCGSCISSMVSVDIEVEELSNDRVSEAVDVLDEFLPFHAQLFSINYMGGIEEFIQSPIEEIQAIIQIETNEYVISGNANDIFTRTMSYTEPASLIPDRGDISEQTIVSSGKLGTAYNDQIVLISPDIGLNDVGIIRLNHFMEILSPHVNAGIYKLDEIQDKTAKVTSTVSEPLNETMFTFNVTNIIYSNNKTDIIQDNLIELLDNDDDIDFSLLGVKTLWDVDNTPDYTGGSWKIEISSTAYEIDKIINGKLNIKYDITLPSSNVSGVSYKLLDDDDNEILTSTSGEILVSNRAFIKLNDTEFTEDNIHQFINYNDLFVYDNTEYKIIEFDGVNFWINGYSDGNVGSANGVKIHRRLIDGAVGLFGYRGLKLNTLFDHESEFGMQGGQNIEPITENNNFIQNYLFKIGSDDWYKIADINGTTVTLAGPQMNWGTLSSGGTSVGYSIAHIEKLPVNVGFVPFDELDKDGHDVVIREILDVDAGTNTIKALSANGDGNSVIEHVQQEETISFQIEWANGNVEEGEV